MTTLADLEAAGILEVDVPMGALTTYRSGGPAKYLATVDTVDELRALVESGLPSTEETLVLGRGSNLVVADDGFDGLVIKPDGEFVSVAVEGLEVQAGAATPLSRVARTSVEEGVSGLEFFVGIPGSVGGAVRQNAGCFGSETVDVLIDVEMIDLRTGEYHTVPAPGLDMSYRHSNIAGHQMVVRARFRGTSGDVQDGKDRMREITRWRKEHQPGGTLNAGSVFKNPPDKPAGQLIDELGLKGMSVGGASVSEKHANFIVATQEATASDIYELVGLVKDAVLERSGTKLEPEIQFIGFDQ